MTPTSDELLAIETPENVAFGYKLAGIGSRFMAAAIDTVLIIILQAGVGFVAALLLRGRDVTEMETPVMLWLFALLSLIAFALFWSYYILFEMFWNGQSPGKRVVGLRVIRKDGTPITLAESVIRNLVRLIDFLPMAYGAGVVSMFIDTQSRRLGDLAAGTLVVFDRAPVTLESLTQTTAQPIGINTTLAMRHFVQSFPLERLTERELAMGEDILRRWDDLANRDDMAKRVLTLMFTKMQTPEPTEGFTAPGDVLAAMVQERRGNSG